MDRVFQAAEHSSATPRSVDCRSQGPSPGGTGRSGRGPSEDRATCRWSGRAWATGHHRYFRMDGGWGRTTSSDEHWKIENLTLCHCKHGRLPQVANCSFTTVCPPSFSRLRTGTLRVWAAVESFKDGLDSCCFMTLSHTEGPTIANAQVSLVEVRSKGTKPCSIERRELRPLIPRMGQQRSCR